MDIHSGINKQKWHQGCCIDAYNYLGAHKVEKGVRFAVWAPHAKLVQVVGTFNDWDGKNYEMQQDHETGIWSTIVKGAKNGDLYKFQIFSSNGTDSFLKSDPYGRAMELRPKTASIIVDEESFCWDDECWVGSGNINRATQPISVYEVHLGSWKKKADSNGYLNYRELADLLIPYAIKMGFTHLELMPVAEHPHDKSWGYQQTGYFAPTSRYGKPKDLKYFINKCHLNGLGILMDWVPAHFPKDETGLKNFDGAPLYEYDDHQKREQKDWGTYLFDYQEPGVQNFLLSNACYWCNEFHIDGFRVDAVASMLYLDYGKEAGEWSTNEYGGNENLEAVAFLKKFNKMIHREFPNVLTFAEESSTWPGVTAPVQDGGLGFDFKWNMGWMNDTLEYITQDPGTRNDNADQITFSLSYADSENFMLPLSHDEVVHLKKPLLKKSWGNRHQQFANLRLLYSYMFGHPGKKLLFMGAELAEKSEWSVDQQLNWNLLDEPKHAGIKRLIRDLNNIYTSKSALWESSDNIGFRWITGGAIPNPCLSFLRTSSEADKHLVFITNFSDQYINEYQISNFPADDYDVIFNSESSYYGGTDEGGIYYSEGIQYANIPAFSALILSPLNPYKAYI